MFQGKLLYCHPPPHINPKDFQPQHSNFQRRDLDGKDLSSTTNKQKIKRIENTVDKNFFHQVHTPQDNYNGSYGVFSTNYIDYGNLNLDICISYRKMYELCPKVFSQSWVTNQEVDLLDLERLGQK